jgi:FtsP/CotA-like multicopper oxidase with cupredoxin domain
MCKITRREAIKLGLIGGGLLLSQGFPSSASAQLSPQIKRFQLPFRTPPLLNPVRSYEDGERPLDVYEITMHKCQREIFPGLSTTIWGYNGIIPGPIIRQRGGFRDEDQGRSSLVRFINKLGTNLENGEEVPIKTTVHLHGMASLPQYDGHAEDLIAPDYFKDYFYPNDRAATIWYHDHAIDKTSRNVYMGLAGMYIVEDEEERQFNLPQGQYDVPLILQDLNLGNDGKLIFNDRNQISLYGDIVLVNGVPWPTMKVARRKYRFRVLNASTARGYQLVLSRDERRLTKGDKLFVIASDCGLLREPVELSSPLQVLQIWPAERYEFIIDFSHYPLGTQVFLRNPNLQLTSNLDNDERLQAIMRFEVERDEPDDSNLPDYLRHFERLIEQISSGQDVPVRQFVFGRGQDWTINGKVWHKNRVDANPKPGAIEIWELINRGGGWVHPVHIHFADWQILARNGNHPLAYEQGWKDVFRVGHFETVRVIAKFGRRNGDYLEGKYMFHCHNLVHEDHSMMTQFEVGKNGPSPFSAPALPISEMKSFSA